MQKAKVFTRAAPPADGELAEFGRRFLAEGDSWFTIGTLNLFQASNVLTELQFDQRNAVVSYASPGDTLQRMVDAMNDRDFDMALWNRSGGNFASFWEGIIVSAGGNDLIAAADVPPVRNNRPVPAQQRLFLTAAEAAQSNAPDGPLRRISEGGWSTLTGYLRANFTALVDRKSRGPSANSPLFLHTYATPTARPSGAGPGSRGWLFPAMEAYGIAPAEMQPVCSELFARLREFLLGLDAGSGQPQSLPTVHVFDSAGLKTIVPAQPDASGNSGDWINEIHLNAGGYQKMGLPFGKFIEQRVEAVFG
jgi:lysophospholipase L1-like esterase